MEKFKKFMIHYRGGIVTKSYIFERSLQELNSEIKKDNGVSAGDKWIPYHSIDFITNSIV